MRLTLVALFLTACGAVLGPFPHDAEQPEAPLPWGPSDDQNPFGGKHKPVAHDAGEAGAKS